MSGTAIDTRVFDPLAYQEDPTAFRAEVRAWLEATIPPDWKQRVQGGGADVQKNFQRWLLEETNKVRLAGAHWPKKWGGADLSLANQVIIQEEMARLDAPDPDVYTANLFHLPATLFSYGTAEQREKYLMAAKIGAELWCQGFSEPGAGSDLAALRTRADRRTKDDGSEVYVINGQKTWSSFSLFADKCLLLARTDFDTPRKQAGISYFIMDMKAPGITVRPIPQITGESEFCEIFLDDVEIPVEDLIGAENEGWKIAQSTLSAERGLITFMWAERFAYALRRDLEKGRGRWLEDPQYRREYAMLYAEFQGIRALVKRLLRQIEADPEMGGAEIVQYIKLRWAELIIAYNHFLLRAEGVDAQLEEEPIPGAGFNTGLRMGDYLKSFAINIAGGTNEIMRNLISERILGLPKG